MGRYYVYNTVTGRYEFVELPEPVHSELKRWDWRQEKQETAVHKHEIVASELHGDYEDFHEFADETDVGREVICKGYWFEAFVDESMTIPLDVFGGETVLGGFERNRVKLHSYLIFAPEDGILFIYT